MQWVGLGHEPNEEIATALERSDRAMATPPSARPSDVVKLAAIGCIGAGVMVGGIAAPIAFSVLGAAALWLSFNHDGATVERNRGPRFDPVCGLALADVMETVLADELVAVSVSGRFAVVSVEVPEIAARIAANDRGGADSVTIAVAHRLRSHGWVGARGGPFGPLIFLSRPGVFHVVLRDVLDDQTTRWLARRLLEIVNRPVRWNGDSIEPRAVIGIAVGPAAQRLELVGQAAEARGRARRDGAGSIVCHEDPRTTSGGTWLVSDLDRLTIGRVVEPAPGGGELFGEAAAFLRAVDDALEVAAETGTRCFVRVGAAALSHWDTPARVAARVNAAGAHGRVGIVVSADLASRAHGLVWEHVDQLRRCGLEVLVDRSDPASDVRWDPTRPVDGIILPSGSVARPTPAPAVDTGVGAVVADGFVRTISAGKSSRYPKEMVTPVR